MTTDSHQIFIDIYEDHDTDHLHQGDIFPSNLISTIFSNEEEEIIYEEEELVGWILLNPDCDVYEKGRINFLTFAPIYDLNYYAINFSSSKKNIKSLIQQKKKEFYFLYPDQEISTNGSFVQIGNVESVAALMPFNDSELGQLQIYDLLIRNRIKRLKHKWKAELAHKLGNYYNRMGTPDLNENDIDSWIDVFKKSTNV